MIPAAEKTDNDKQYIGNYLPKVMMGWNNTFTYKNFDLGINMRSWIGFDVYNTYPMYLGYPRRERRRTVELVETGG